MQNEDAVSLEAQQQQEHLEKKRKEYEDEIKRRENAIKRYFLLLLE